MTHGLEVIIYIYRQNVKLPIYLLLYFGAPTGIKLKHLEQLNIMFSVLRGLVNLSKFPEIDLLFYRSCACIFSNQKWVFK